MLPMSIYVMAQTDSIPSYSKTFRSVIGKADWPSGMVRGFVLGDSLTTILHSEKAILEAQGDDFLYYRVLCDSTLSAEISYTFNEKRLLVSIGIEFFESCVDKQTGYLSDEFLINLSSYYTDCTKEDIDTFQCISVSGMHMEYQKIKNEKCVIHTQIEFY